MEAEIENFLKIHNPRGDLSYISDSIELKSDEIYGRMIVAKEKLLAGDIIAIEDPFFWSMDKCCMEQKRCASCFKKTETFQTCQSCGLIKFCSEKCEKDCWNYYHKYECENFHEIDSDDNFLLMMNRTLFKSVAVCGSIKNLTQIIDSIDNSTIFDVKNELAACYNLECGNVGDDFSFIHSCLESPFLKQYYSTKEDERILKKIILRILGILNRNSFTINFEGYSAGAVYPFGSLINHSCTPNLEKINMRNKAVFICNSPVEKGQQLFLCYRRPFYYDSIEKRQKSLFLQFNFRCKCQACTDERFLNYVIKFNNIQKINNLSQFTRNCEFINDSFVSYPCDSIINIIYVNKKFLQQFLDEY